MELTHFDEEGRARMVDVSAKTDTIRVAIAQGRINMQPETLLRIRNGQIAKGGVLAVAQIAGIMAAKQTSNLIPMCHPLVLHSAIINYQLLDLDCILIEAEVKVTGKTGVEMEALTAVSVAALTIYDMCKAIDKTMTISDVCLLEKTGGKSGHFMRN